MNGLDFVLYSLCRAFFGKFESQFWNVLVLAQFWIIVSLLKAHDHSMPWEYLGTADGKVRKFQPSKNDEISLR